MARDVPRAGYGADLAHVHDAGFGGVARAAARTLLAELRRVRVARGRVVDLGCGSGVLAGALASAGYDVLGLDLSPALLRLARRRAPSAVFRRGSFVDADLPPCAAVVAAGEVFSYALDRRNTRRALARTLRRIQAALHPGGLLLFDTAGPRPAAESRVREGHATGPGWAVLSRSAEDAARRALVRHIVTFRRVGGRWRRSEETHRLRLWPRAEVLSALRSAGFRARTLPGYPGARLPPDVCVYLARKPAATP